MGHPIEIFTPPPLDSYNCAICHDILEAAVSFMECGHTFCDECAQDWLPSKSCPTCRKRVTGTVPNFLAREIIGVMGVKCPNHCGTNETGEALEASDGCEWVGECKDLKDHEKICNFKMVTCEIEGCDHQCRKKDMASHLSGEGLIHHWNLLEQSFEKKQQAIKAESDKKIEDLQAIVAQSDKKIEDAMQAITAQSDKKIEDAMQSIVAQSDKKIEDAMQATVAQSGKKIEDAMQATVAQSGKKIEDAMQAITAQSDKKINDVKGSLKRSIMDMVKNKLKEEIEPLQKRVSGLPEVKSVEWNKRG